MALALPNRVELWKTLEEALAPNRLPVVVGAPNSDPAGLEAPNKLVIGLLSPPNGFVALSPPNNDVAGLFSAPPNKDVAGLLAPKREVAGFFSGSGSAFPIG